MKPSLVIYGNCQGGALSVIFGADPDVTAAFDIVYVPSFEDRNPQRKEVAQEAFAAAAILFEQYDPVQFPHRSLLPPSCVTVTYPSMDLHLLWPLNFANAYNDPPTPENPWGRFPYGDRVIIECVERGMGVDEILAHYESTAAQRLPDLDRYAQLEHARITARDEKCGVRMGDFLWDRWRDENLFWAVNHPSMSPLRELSRRLIARVRQDADLLDRVKIDETIASLPAPGPLGAFRIPVHPRIAEHFKLRWYPPEWSDEYGPRDSRMTYREYLREMAATAVRIRNADPVAAAILS